jgi:Zn-dependent metalloprotease
MEHATARWVSRVLLLSVSTLALLSCAKDEPPAALAELAEPIDTPGWITFKADTRIDPRTLFERHGRLFELSTDSSMRLVEESVDELGIAQFRFQQFHRDIEVEGGEFRVRARDGRAVSANGRLEHNFAPATTEPQLNEERARAIVESRMQARRYYRSGALVAELEAQSRGETSDARPAGTLVFVELPDTHARILAWRFDAYVEPLQDSRRIYVDAASGAIIKETQLLPNCFAGSGPTSFRGNQNFNTGRRNVPQTGDRFVLLDDCHANELHLLSFNVTSGGSFEVFDNDNNWSDVDRGLVTSYWALGIAYDFFDLVLNRKSYDGKNANMIIRNDPNLGDNANGGGGVINIGLATAGNSTDDYNTTDIVGHEFTHSLIESSAKLGYDVSKESAALNESFSDIFGEMVESWDEQTATSDWVIGADKGCNPPRLCRNLLDPNARSHPATYKGNFWQSTNIDPHVNGTVQNRWFALLTDGGVGTNAELGAQYNIAGIGKSKSTRIAYRTLTRYLNANSDYLDARNGSIQSARDLFGDGSAEQGEVTKAWCAVGLCPYTIPKQPDIFDRPNGNPNPVSPNNNNSAQGATPVGSGTLAWNMSSGRPQLEIADLSIYPFGDHDYFQIRFPDVPGLGGNVCFPSGYSANFSTDVDVRVYVGGALVKYEHMVSYTTFGVSPTGGGEIVLQISAPFPGQVLAYTLSLAYFQRIDPDCWQTEPPNKWEQIHNCPMCDFGLLSEFDRVILDPPYRQRSKVAPQEHFFYHRGGALSVPITVLSGNDLQVQMLDATGKEVAAASRTAGSNSVTLGAQAPEGVYSLKFSRFGNGTQLEVRTPSAR